MKISDITVKTFVDREDLQKVLTKYRPLYIMEITFEDIETMLDFFSNVIPFKKVEISKRNMELLSESLN